MHEKCTPWRGHRDRDRPRGGGTGYGVLRRCDPYPLPGLRPIETGAVRPARRLLAIYEEVSGLLDKYVPECLALERALLLKKNITSAMHVSEARGVILLAAEQRGISVTIPTGQDGSDRVGSGRSIRCRR